MAAWKSNSGKKVAKRSKTRKALRDEKEARIRHIVTLMTTPGGWRTGVTGRKLAEEYGVHQTTIDREAAEASRIVRGDVVDQESMRALLISQTQLLVAMATKTSKTRDAIAGLEFIANMMGLTRQRLEIELDADLDRKLSELQGLVSPEVFHVVTSIFAGKGGQSPPRDGDGDAGGED